MDTKKIVQLLQNKKTQNYTFNTIFFIIFSIFVVFAIRPNITTAFTLRKELQNLKLENRQLDAQILKIVELQSVAEAYRNELSLLEEALPSSPQVAKVIDDVRNSASGSAMLIDSIRAEEILLQDDGSIAPENEQENTETVIDTSLANGTPLQTFVVHMQVESTEDGIRTFLTSLLGQRRVKTLYSVEIVSVNEEASQIYEDSYTVTFVINGYYL